MVNFTNIVDSTEKDNKLEDRMDQEQGAFLTKTAGLYLSYAYQHGAHDIWGLLPEYYRDQQKEVRENSSVLDSFLSQDDTLIIHPQAYISKRDFVEQLKTFASENNISLRGYKLTSSDFFNLCFQQRDLKIENKRMFYPPNQDTIKKKCKYILGVGLKGILTTYNKQI